MRVCTTAANLSNLYFCVQTLMAHATQLGDEELRVVAAAGAAIVHCPLSNFYFGDKMFR